MEIRIINNNIVSVFEDIIADTSLDGLKTLISSTYSSKSPNPIVAQFPNMLAITAPEAQVSLILEGKKLVLTDQAIGKFSDKDMLSFATLAKKATEITGKQIVAYGFNFIYELSGMTFNRFSSKLKSKFFKSRLSSVLPPNSSLRFIMPSVSIRRDDCNMTFKFKEVVDNPQNEPKNILNININVHYNKNIFPEIDILKSNYEEVENYIEEYIKEIFV